MQDRLNFQRRTSPAISSLEAVERAKRSALLLLAKPLPARQNTARYPLGFAATLCFGVTMATNAERNLQNEPQPPPSMSEPLGTLPYASAARAEVDPLATRPSTVGGSEGPSEARASSGSSRALPRMALPDYKVLGELGRGGMRVVYKARREPDRARET